MKNYFLNRAKLKESITYEKIGDDRKTFHPYGVSLIESARGPAHQLSLMEDAMVVYRLTYGSRESEWDFQTALGDTIKEKYSNEYVRLIEVKNL